MDTFLKNKTTGQIVRSNSYNAKDPDLIPCIAPWDKPALGGGPVSEPTGPGDAFPPSGLLDKDVAGALVVELFGSKVEAVKKDDILQYALELGASATDKNTKLEIVTMIHNIKNSHGPDQE